MKITDAAARILAVLPCPRNEICKRTGLTDATYRRAAAQLRKAKIIMYNVTDKTVEHYQTVSEL
jgi:hypothetical protein